MTNERLMFGYEGIEGVHKLRQQFGLLVDGNPKFDEVLKVQPAYTTGWKPVHPLLEPMLGVFDIKITTLPKWYGMVMEEFNEYIDSNIDESKKEKIYADVEFYNANNALPEDPSHFIQAVWQYNNISLESFKDKLFPNGQKISKYLKKVCELTLGKELDHMQSPWAKMIEANQVENVDGLKMVITNSVASLMGMSLYLESGRSCQTFTKGGNEGHSSRLEGVIYDPNVVCMYISNGKTKLPAEKGERFDEHPVMKQRLLLRLVEIPNKYQDNGGFVGCINKSGTRTQKVSSNIGIMIDRSYPDNKYVNEVYDLLYRLCEENGYTLLEPERGNMSQGSTEKPVKFQTDGQALTSFDYESFYLTHCKDLKEKCRELKTESICKTICKPVNEDICNLCKSGLEISKDTTTSCKKCQLEKCPFEVKNCCQCYFVNRNLKVGYKDNSNTGEIEKHLDIKGKFRDRYPVRKVVKK
jgi:hypothetical protein